MALDKAVDSAVLDADMSAVASAIRAKGGTSAPLSWPEGYVDAVEAIQAGGGCEGLPNGIAAITQGEITLAESLSQLTIQHGLGVVPDIVVGYVADYIFPATAADYPAFLYLPLPFRVSSSVTHDNTFGLLLVSSGYSGVANSFTSSSASAVDDVSITLNRASSVYLFNAGNTYRWLAVKFAGVSV